MWDVDVPSKAEDLFYSRIEASVLTYRVTPLAVSDHNRALSLPTPTGVPA
jgi:hypothetical protein